MRRPGELRLALMGALHKRPGARMGDLAEHLGTDPRAVAVTLRRLEAERLAMRPSRGRWLLTYAGCGYLAQVREWVGVPEREEGPGSGV